MGMSHYKWTPWGWVIPRKTGKRAYFNIHIPKNAGCSVSVDIEQFLPEGEGFWSRERCYGQEMEEHETGDMDMAFFREPVSHVHSQFLECKYDNNWRVAKKNFFREEFETVTNWLTHFQGGAEQADFGCYHPYNMQTRALTCKDKNCHHYDSEPSVKDALSNLDSLGFIGLVEHYQASLCLFHAKAHDMKEPLPTFCNCKDVAAWNSFRSNHEGHGLPAHSVVDLTQEDKAMIKALTRKDEQVYQKALRRFRSDIAKVEDHFNVRLWC